MGGSPKSRKTWVRAIEAVLVVFLFLAIIELILIYRRPTAAPPEVRLIEKNVETLVVKLPPGASTNRAILDIAQPSTNSTKKQEIVIIQRSSPPLLAFENIRRGLGLLPPAPPDVVMAYRRNEKQKEVPFTQAGQTNRMTELMVTNVTRESVVISSTLEGKSPVENGTKSPAGDPFRISLPR